MKRRQFLVLSSGVAGSVLIAHPLKSQVNSETGSQLIYQSNPKGLLDIALQAQPLSTTIGGQNLTLLGYNAQVPGPRLEVRPGDQVRIQFTNHLDQLSNLHFHGLHIPPTGTADNIFREIPPGETALYEFTVPLDHPSALTWYHPHIHGSVADQVFRGLAGVIVVRGDLDTIPEIQAAQEQFLILQDFDPNPSSLVIDPTRQFNGREGSLLTVSGKVNPAFTLATGDLLRFRVVNASPSRFYRLALEDHPLYLIGTDGGGLETPVELEELLLGPGERADLLIQGIQKSGEYRLLNLPYSRGSMMMSGMDHSQPESQSLARIIYKGSVDPKPLPTQLVSVEELPPTDLVRQFTLAHGHGTMAGQPIPFLINDQLFDHHRVDTQVKLNTVEEWELINPEIMDHPFHLHTNSFQIISRNTQPEPYRAWKDTVVVPEGETIRIRVRFSKYPGKTVYHCHILDHGDLGMMGIIEMS